MGGGAENGVLVLAATADRELRIETADGVREPFSDDEAEDVVEGVLAPAFADERCAEGLTETVDHIYRYTRGAGPPGSPWTGLCSGVCWAASLCSWCWPGGGRSRAPAGGGASGSH